MPSHRESEMVNKGKDWHQTSSAANILKASNARKRKYVGIGISSLVLSCKSNRQFPCTLSQKLKLVPSSFATMHTNISCYHEILRPQHQRRFQKDIRTLYMAHQNHHPLKIYVNNIERPKIQKTSLKQEFRVILLQTYLEPVITPPEITQKFLLTYVHTAAIQDKMSNFQYLWYRELKKAYLTQPKTNLFELTKSNFFPKPYPSKRNLSRTSMR